MGGARSLARMSQVIAENAAYWETLAPHRLGESVQAIKDGSVLDERELEALGTVAGQRVVQLAASVGDEAMQMALMGASVTAVDIAPSHIATGRAKAAEVGANVDFRLGDMTELTDDLRDIDIFYLSWGGLCWVPDLGTWMRDLAGRLRPGGRVVLAEHHPLWEVLSVASPEALTVTSSYFEPTWRKARDLDKAPQILKTIDIPVPTSTSFVWGLGEVVTAFLGAGLRLVHLREYPITEMYDGLTDAAHIPAIYITAAAKTG